MKSTAARLSGLPRLLWFRAVEQRYLHDFVFIHINKTGGTSIEAALGIPLEHYSAREKIRHLGRERWRRKFSFAFVRNPWDKVVSHYTYRVRTNQTGLGARPIEFRDWVAMTYGRQDPRYYDKPRMFRPQSDWICDDDGSVAVNFVGRFESLAQDFEVVANRLRRPARLPHLKSSARDHYRQYYDDETARIVGDWFAEDIRRFGYEF